MIPIGRNSKLFHNDEKQIIQKIEAFVNYTNENICFHITTDKKSIIRDSLGDLVASVRDVEDLGTRIYVKGIDDIKKAFDKLKNDNLISEKFYLNIVENFPIPVVGTINILKEPYPKYELKLRLFKMHSATPDLKRASVKKTQVNCHIRRR